MKMDDGLNDGWDILGAILWDIPYGSNYVDTDISHRLTYCRGKDPVDGFNLLLANRVILHSEYPVLTSLYDDKGLEMPRESIYPHRGFYSEAAMAAGEIITEEDAACIPTVTVLEVPIERDGMNIRMAFTPPLTITSGEELLIETHEDYARVEIRAREEVTDDGTTTRDGTHIGTCRDR